MGEPRHVLITGGSQGIGLATARRFGLLGDRITIVARSQAPLAEAVESLEDEGIAVRAFSGSVSHGEQMERAVGEAWQVHGPIDVLINNAGMGPEAQLQDMSAGDWQSVVDVNLTGVFLTTQKVCRRMIETGHGGVVLMTGSINALIPKSPAVAYSATKAAVDAMVKGLAVELAPHGIRVCGVHPGYIDTPLLEKVYSDPEQLAAWKADRTARVPLGRLADPDEIASVFEFLASDRASYITGTSIVVDGGRVANS